MNKRLLLIVALFFLITACSKTIVVEEESLSVVSNDPDTTKFYDCNSDACSPTPFCQCVDKGIVDLGECYEEMVDEFETLNEAMQEKIVLDSKEILEQVRASNFNCDAVFENTYIAFRNNDGDEAITFTECDDGNKHSEITIILENKKAYVCNYYQE